MTEILGNQKKINMLKPVETMVIKLVKTTATSVTFQVASLSGSVVVVTKPKNLIFSSRGGT